MKYIYKYGWSLDARRFRAMRMVRDQTSIFDRRFNKYHHKAVSAWIRRGAIAEAEVPECRDA